jgi:hypothetical protein
MRGGFRVPYTSNKSGKVAQMKIKKESSLLYNQLSSGSEKDEHGMMCYRTPQRAMVHEHRAIVEWGSAGEDRSLGEKRHQCHLLYYKSHMTTLGTGPEAVP